MSIASEINRINHNIAAAYSACDEKGAIIPTARNSANLADTIAGISSLSFEIAAEKPVSNIKTNVIYLIPNSVAQTENVYDEWIYVNNTWELIGNTAIDLSEYYTAQETDLALDSKVDESALSLYDNGYLINGFALESGTVDTSGKEVENNKAMRMTEMIPYASVISCDFLSRTGNLYIAYYDSEGNFATRIGYTPTQTAILSSNYPYFRMCFYEAVVPSRTETEFKSWVTLKIKTAIKSELDEKADQADVTAALNTKADLAETSAALAGKLDVPVNKLGAVTPSITEIDKLCNLVTLAERESPGSAYSRFSIQGGNLYLVSGRSATNAEFYCLGGFLDGENNVLSKFGTKPATIYNDLLVIAPEGATTMIVNTNRNSEYPTSCFNAEYDMDCIVEIKETITQLSRDYSLDVADALIRQAKKNPFQLADLDKGYVTFVFDDLMNEIDSIASIFERYQMPLCLAAIPAKMSQRATWLEQTRGSFTPNMLKSEIMRVVVSNGGEILAHNTSPVVNVTNQYDYDFMYGYFVKCKKAIEEAGFKVRGIIKAGGTGAISRTPEIERWLIGNYEYSNIGSAENYNKERININQPLNDLKAAIQDAYTNHTWLRIMGHGYGAEHLGDYLPDEAALEAILDYCKTLGITVCTYAYIFDNFSSSAFLESLKGNQ